MSENEKFECVKAAIDLDESEEFARYVFEFVLSTGKQSNPDLWKLFVKFVRKDKAHGKLKAKILQRASIHLRDDVSIGVDCIRETYAVDETGVAAVFQELSNVCSGSKLRQLKLFEAYFAVLLNQAVRHFTSDEAIEHIEDVHTNIAYVGEMYQTQKDLSFDERKSLSSIYKNYLAFSVRVNSDLVDKAMLLEVCERLVKVSGNEAANWLTYIAVLKQTNPIGQNDSIRNVYKRAMRFCKGDIQAIYESYRDFETIFGDKFATLQEVESLYSQAKEAASLTTVAGKQAGKASRIDMQADQEMAGKSINMNGIYDKQEQDLKTIFIKGLPGSFTRSDILQMMPNESDVIDVRLVPSKQDYNVNSYVDFVSHEAATAALSLNLKEVEGKRIFVAFSKPPEKAVNENTLFVNNLPFGMTEEEMFECLAFCKADIEQIRLKKAYAFVKFKDSNSMHRTLRKLKDFKIKGRKVKATVAVDQAAKATDKHGRKMSHQSESQSADANVDAVIGKREQAEKEADSKLETAEPKSKTKSNDDFRRLLGLKK